MPVSKNQPHRRLAELLGTRYPILQAPMAGVTQAGLVASVCEAGGLGGHGAAADRPESLRLTLREIRAATDQPFQVNLFDASTETVDEGLAPGPLLEARLQAFHDEFQLGAVPAPKAIFGPAAEQLAVVIEEAVPVVSLHFGADPELIRRCREAGIKLLSSATTVAEAVYLEEAGVDAIIAQGTEAGGHRGTFASSAEQALGTMALVPRVVDAVDLPVIAAGGIMDGRGVRAALALGASGVQLGTAFLGCREAAIHPAWRQQLLQAEGSDTLVTSAMSGKPARGLRNRYIDELERLQEPLLPYPYQYSLSRELRKAAAARGDPDFMAMWAGQGVGLLKNTSVQELIRELAAALAEAD